VVRGGSWNDNRHARALRLPLGDVPDARFYYLGFRVLCVSPILKR
jgi:formylglycine-generating enzyme required for sulfatase activity